MGMTLIKTDCQNGYVNGGCYVNVSGFLRQSCHSIFDLTDPVSNHNSLCNIPQILG